MKIYIAGPDVFEKNAKEIGEKYKAICSAYGHTGLYPLDNECDSSAEIYKGNVALIDSADAVVANGNNFRGEMDVGTAFEVGYAAAKGKKILIYMTIHVLLLKSTAQKMKTADLWKISVIRSI